MIKMILNIKVLQLVCNKSFYSSFKEVWIGISKKRFIADLVGSYFFLHKYRGV